MATTIVPSMTSDRSSTRRPRTATIVLVTMLIAAAAFVLGRTTVENPIATTNHTPTQVGASATPALPDLSTSTGRAAFVREFGPGSFGGVTSITPAQVEASATPALPDLSTPAGRAAFVREFGPGSFGGAPTQSTSSPG